MTREEFGKGWMVLAVQPWGRWYREATEISKVQAELYYRKLGYTNAFVWEAVCLSYATGDHWPSIDELKLSIKQNSNVEEPLRISSTHDIEWNQAPEPLALLVLGGGITRSRKFLRSFHFARNLSLHLVFGLAG